MSFADFLIYIGPSLMVATIVVVTYLICKLISFKEIQLNKNNDKEIDINEIELVVINEENRGGEFNG